MFGDRGWLCVHSSAATPYSNRYSNPANFGGVCGCSPMFTKRLDLREPDTHTHVRTPIIQLGVKWSQVQILSARPKEVLDLVVCVWH